MPLPSVFDISISNELIERINKLTSTTHPQWGKMNVNQMLAHANVAYEMMYEEGKHPKPNGLMKFILKLFVKNGVVNERRYKQNIPTGPQFIIKDHRQFDEEKNRLIQFIQKTQQLGSKAFEGKVSHSFGKLSSEEWNNLMYKHLDHHLTQFGV